MTRNVEGTPEQLVASMAKNERLTVQQALLRLDEENEYNMGLDELDLMSPRDYAIRRRMAPQQVYYYIKAGVIESLDCICHRHVIDANQADRALDARKRAQRDKGGVK